MDDKLSRRALLERGAAIGVMAVVGAAACGKKTANANCTDISGLPPADVQVRTTVAYTDVSIEAGKLCSGCQQFIPPPTDAPCGTCKVVKGPINPKGMCKLFVAKPPT
jgi:hypothetical protein